jgi:hypothetical protein
MGTSIVRMLLILIFRKCLVAYKYYVGQVIFGEFSFQLAVEAAGLLEIIVVTLFTLSILLVLHEILSRGSLAILNIVIRVFTRL